MMTISARDFNRDVSAAKRAAAERPVVVTDRGRPAYVLMTFADYERLGQSSAPDFVDRLRMPVAVEVDFEPVRLEPQVPEF